MSSFEATRQIRKERPETKVVFLSMYDDEEYLAECVEIGANGYVLKDSPVGPVGDGHPRSPSRRQLPQPALLTRLVDGFRVQGSNPCASRASAR